MKDFYAILGVSINAEAEVISAAYKALAKKYHPDIYKGTKKDSENRIREVNEAYSTLSNNSKKEAYDRDFLKNKSTGSFDDFNDSEFEDTSNIFDTDWNILIEVYPDAERLRQSLSKISQKLGFLFQVLLLDKQLGAKAEQAANNLRKDFLERYFGTNKKIQDLATQALKLKDIEVAKEINKKITLLGDDAAEKIYNSILARLDKNIYKSNDNDIFDRNIKEKNTVSLKHNKEYYKNILIFLILGIGLIIFLLYQSKYTGGGNCFGKATDCNDNQLCEYATVIEDKEVVWSTYKKNHADTAKTRNLDCNVGFKY